MIECSSKIDRVTVYARGAIVTRVVQLPSAVSSEPCVLALTAVSPMLDPKSIRAKTNNARSVLSIETRWDVRAAVSQTPAIQAEIEALELKQTALNEARALVHARTELLRNAHPDPRLRARKVAQDNLSRVKDSLQTQSVLTELLQKEYDQLRALEDEATRLMDALGAARLRLSQANAAERQSATDPQLSLLIHLGAEDPSQSLTSLELEYTVDAARWWPTYKVRFSQGARKVRCSLDAFVAQASGEDWSSVLVSLSTADLVRDARLPTLPSLRLGRAQPPKKAFRPPPEGLEELFAGYDRAMLEQSSRTQNTRTIVSEASNAPIDALLQEQSELAAHLVDEEVEAEEGGADEMAKLDGAPSMSFGASYQGPPPPSASAPMNAPPRAAMSSPMMPGAIPPPQKKAGRFARDEQADYSVTRAGGVGGGGMVPMQSISDRRQFASREAGDIEPGDEWLDFDELTLKSEANGRGQRGRLARTVVDQKRHARLAVKNIVEQKDVGGDLVDPRSVRGSFDYRYDSVLRADIPGDAAIHRISMLEAEGDAKPLFRVVPKEAPTVFREAEMRNPFDAPLLVGPAEVFYDDALLTRAKVPTVDRGGTMHIGLGMEERIRVARNSRVHEGSAGLLGGSTQIDHVVTIELSSSLGEPATVVVIDRIPYAKKEEDIEIALVSTKPKADTYTQSERGEPVRGGLRWSVEVAAGAKTLVEFQYKITFSSKLELNGGNRRD